MNIASPKNKEKKPKYDLEIANRFTKFRMKYIADSQNQAAKELKCNQAKISLIESGGQGIDYKFIALLMKKYNLNVEWLTTGMGAMTVKPETQKPGELLTNIADLRVEIEHLKKAIMIIQANQNHFLKEMTKFMEENKKS